MNLTEIKEIANDIVETVEGCEASSNECIMWRQRYLQEFQENKHVQMYFLCTSSKTFIENTPEENLEISRQVWKKNDVD
jgi:hypothetical protein